MSLVDAGRIKTLMQQMAEVTRRLDALEQYITEIDFEDDRTTYPVEIRQTGPKRGPGRPRKVKNG